jgi:hypothetical protein
MHICKRVALLTKKKAAVYLIPLEKLKLKIKMQEAIDSFKNYILLISVDLYHM